MNYQAQELKVKGTKFVNWQTKRFNCTKEEKVQVWQVKKFLRYQEIRRFVNWQRVKLNMFERKIGCEFEKLTRLTYLR